MFALVASLNPLKPRFKAFSTAESRPRYAARALRASVTPSPQAARTKRRNRGIVRAYIRRPHA